MFSIYLFSSVPSNFLGRYMKFQPNFCKNFFIFLQTPFSEIPQNLSNFSKCSPIVEAIKIQSMELKKTFVWRRFKFLSHDQDEEHVSCLASLRVSVNNYFKKLKHECTCATHVRWCSVHARACVEVHPRASGLQYCGKIVG